MLAKISELRGAAARLLSLSEQAAHPRLMAKSAPSELMHIAEQLSLLANAMEGMRDRDEKERKEGET